MQLFNPKTNTQINPKTALYTAPQVYQIEQNWFNQGNPSFGLMQQASWQMATWINSNIMSQYAKCDEVKYDEQGQINNKSPLATLVTLLNLANKPLKPAKSACVWVGSGNNGGDGWLVAYYLQQFGWQVTVIEVAKASTADSQKAKQMALDAGCSVIKGIDDAQVFSAEAHDVHIDALFGIGLDRQPTGDYANAIELFNQVTASVGKLAIAIDVPSGLVASTGKVFAGVAITADITLCLLAQKLGLFTKDGKDYAGQVVYLPLIPLNDKLPHGLSDKLPDELVDNRSDTSHQDTKPIAHRLTAPYPMPARQANSHKGSFGHVLVVGGNQTQTAQGMGGASILSATSAFAVGVGKVSVACHLDYHGALLSRLPNAMSVDLHNIETVCALMQSVDVVAIGMGLGRESSSQALFVRYLQQAMQANCQLIIDADGLYHLASLVTENTQLIEKLQAYGKTHFVAYTPHTGEMAGLLNTSAKLVEADRVLAVKQATIKFGGRWLLKGAGNIVSEQGQMYVCDVGNAGMATAGMGDVLAGVIAGLQAQSSLTDKQKSLSQAVLIHGTAGDILAKKVGQYGVQAAEMGKAVEQVIHNIS